MIESILNSAKNLGACDKASEIYNWKDLSALFFSPQGQEFCEKNLFPTLKDWEEVKRYCDTTEYSIFINENEVSIDNKEKVAFIGKTTGYCKFSMPDNIHTVILMHGACAFIEALEYAVVRIVKMGDCKVTINKDKTSVIL